MIWRLVLAACLTLGIAAFGSIERPHAQFNGCSPGGGFCAPKGAIASCAGFIIEGGATSTPAAGASTATQNITTTHTNDIIFSLMTINGNTQISSVTDTAGLSWTSTRATGGNPAANSIVESWALSTGTLSGDTITTHFNNTNSSFLETIVFGVNGSHISSPFDSGGSSNIPVTGITSPVSAITNNVNTLLLGFFRDGGTMGPAAGFTQIAASASFTLAQYKPLSAAGTNSVSDPSTNAANGAIGDALVCGP